MRAWDWIARIASPLARPDFGKKLPFRFQPIGAGVTWKSESSSSFENEISADSNLVIGRIDVRNRARGFCLTRSVALLRRCLFHACRWTPPFCVVDPRTGRSWTQIGACPNFLFLGHELISFRTQSQ